MFVLTIILQLTFVFYILSLLYLILNDMLNSIIIQILACNLKCICNGTSEGKKKLFPPTKKTNKKNNKGSRNAVTDYILPN